MNITIHRGTNQIGGSCVEIESQGQRLLVDFGLPLDAEGDPEKYLPNTSGLDGKDPSLLGILISHPHQDHWGLLSQVAPTIKVGMGAAARRILTAAAPFMLHPYPPPSSGWDFEHGNPLEIGPFTVTPYLVDHSAYDAYSLLIEADGKRIYYSGDFRAHGRKNCFEKTLTNPPKNIDVLLLEGTTISPNNGTRACPTEEEIELQIEEVLSSTEGLALMHCSSQNIDRIVSAYRACVKTGRTLLMDLYTALILDATGNKNLPKADWKNVKVFIPHSQRVKILKNEWFDLRDQYHRYRIYGEHLERNPDKYTLLFRPLYQKDLEYANCLAGASYIYSQWAGYWDKDDFKSLRSWIKKHDIPKHSIHTSGHAMPADLQKFAQAINPKKIVPIHSFEPGRYPELFNNVEIHTDGETWKV